MDQINSSVGNIGTNNTDTDIADKLQNRTEIAEDYDEQEADKLQSRTEIAEDYDDQEADVDKPAFANRQVAVGLTEERLDKDSGHVEGSAVCTGNNDSGVNQVATVEVGPTDSGLVEGSAVCTDTNDSTVSEAATVEVEPTDSGLVEGSGVCTDTNDSAASEAAPVEDRTSDLGTDAMDVVMSVDSNLVNAKGDLGKGSSQCEIPLTQQSCDEGEIVQGQETTDIAMDSENRPDGHQIMKGAVDASEDSSLCTDKENTMVIKESVMAGNEESLNGSVDSLSASVLETSNGVTSGNLQEGAPDGGERPELPTKIGNIKCEITSDMMEYRKASTNGNRAASVGDSTDSSSDSTSDSDSDEPLRPEKPKVYTTNKRATWQNDDQEEHSRTKGEVSFKDMPPIHALQITIDEKTALFEVGHVSSIVGFLVIIQAKPATPALDMDTVLFLEDRTPLGQVFETFGPVPAPLYAIRFNSKAEIEERGIKQDMSVLFIPDSKEWTHYVFVEQLKRLRGSDASWEDDNEPPDKFLEYSDDEKERHARQKYKGKTRLVPEGDEPEKEGQNTKESTKRRRRKNQGAAAQQNGDFSNGGSNFSGSAPRPYSKGVMSWPPQSPRNFQPRNPGGGFLRRPEPSQDIYGWPKQQNSGNVSHPGVPHRQRPPWQQSSGHGPRYDNGWKDGVDMPPDGCGPRGPPGMTSSSSQWSSPRSGYDPNPWGPPPTNHHQQQTGHMGGTPMPSQFGSPSMNIPYAENTNTEHSYPSRPHPPQQPFPGSERGYFRPPQQFPNPQFGGGPNPQFGGGPSFPNTLQPNWENRSRYYN